MTKKPKYLILENVRDLVSKRFFPLFSKWMEELDAMGYDNHWQVINASDCNIPQNRQRVILVSIRTFNFPNPMELTNSLDHQMEMCAVPGYYIPADQVGCILEEQPSQETLRIRQATKVGFIDVKKGGVFDASFPRSKTRRGRVQGNGGDICPTLTASASDFILRFEGYKEQESKFIDHKSQVGLCDEESSMISPDYARNFICDFVIGKEQPGSQLSMFD